MPDLTIKRQTLAMETIKHAQAFVDALVQLVQLKEEFAQSGTFVQADFDGRDNLKHLSPGLINAFFGGGGSMDLVKTNYEQAAVKQNFLQLLS